MKCASVRRVKRWLGHHPKATTAVAGCLILFVTLWGYPTFSRHWGLSTTDKPFVFWLQTASGNWAGDTSVVDRWWFDFSAALAIWLNNGLFWAALLFIWQTTHNWRDRMVLAQAFISRDQVNKQALYDVLGADPETMERIKAAFRIGEKSWADQLVVLFGKDEAERLLRMMPQEI